MTTVYQRYQSPKIEGENRRKALADYVRHYTKVARNEPTLLNQKLPRKAFQSLLAMIGNLLQEEARQLSTSNTETVKFLKINSVPACLGDKLTPEIRTFALLLNALSQWTTAEKLAMDRFLFSGDVRKELKSLCQTCPIYPEEFDVKNIELHHPVRDGRPPIPLSKRGHETVEGLIVISPGDSGAEKLVEHRRNSKTRYSWKRLRIGCLAASGQLPESFSETHLRSGRSVLARVKRQTALSAQSILDILDRYSLGLLDE
jgi:hypothetical protein